MTTVQYNIRYTTDKTNMWGDAFEADDTYKIDGQAITFYTKDGCRVYNFDSVAFFIQSPIFKQFGEL